MNLKNTVALPIYWALPIRFQELSTLPKEPGVYAILLYRNTNYYMVRIGASGNLRKRPADYNPLPFESEPRLRITFTIIPSVFRAGMRKLITTKYPNRSDDMDWLEYRIEYVLLETYVARVGQLPPANFQRGSKREYAGHIKLMEEGILRILELEPVDLSEEICLGLRQS